MDKNTFNEAEYIQNSLRYIDMLYTLCKGSKSKHTNYQWQECANSTMQIALRGLVFLEEKETFRGGLYGVLEERRK